MSRSRVRRLIAVAAILAASRAHAATRTPGDAVVARLGEERFERLVQARPDLASRMGWSAAAARLEPVSEVSLADDAAWLADFRRRLAAVPRATLSRAAAIDRDALAACAMRDSLSLAEAGPWRTDPGAAVALVADAVLEPALRLDVGVCERLQRTTRRLTRVPETLRCATVELRRPGRLATERAIVRLEATLRTWRTALPGYFAACRDPERQADLVEADTAAIRAAEKFLVWLRDDRLPTADDDGRLGREGLECRIAAEVGHAPDLSRLGAAAVGRLAATHARLEGLAAALAPGSSAGALRAANAEQAPVPSAVLDSVRAALFDAAARLSALQGFDDARGFAERVRVAAAPEGIEPPLAFEPTLAFASGAVVARLQLATADPSVCAALNPTRARALAAEWLGGRMPVALARARSAGVVRRSLEFPAVAAARAAAAAMALDGATSSLAFAVRDRERMRLGAALAVLGVHAQGRPLADVADTLRAARGFTAPEADDLVRSALHDPTPLAELCAALDDEALVAEVLERTGVAPDLRAYGELPATLIGEQVMAESAARAALARNTRKRAR